MRVYTLFNKQTNKPPRQQQQRKRPQTTSHSALTSHDPNPSDDRILHQATWRTHSKYILNLFCWGHLYIHLYQNSLTTKSKSIKSSPQHIQPGEILCHRPPINRERHVPVNNPRGRINTLYNCVFAVRRARSRQFRHLHTGLFHTPEYPRNRWVEFCTEEPLKERGAGSLEICTLGYFIHTPKYSSLALFQRDILQFPESNFVQKNVVAGSLDICSLGFLIRTPEYLKSELSPIDILGVPELILRRRTARRTWR